MEGVVGREIGLQVARAGSRHDVLGERTEIRRLLRREVHRELVDGLRLQKLPHRHDVAQILGVPVGERY